MRRRPSTALPAEGSDRAGADACTVIADPCWLCGRPLNKRIERHHPVPKSRGGRETVPVHPICHRTLHARFTNTELARHGATTAAVVADATIAGFVRWVANKPPDFHAPTRRGR